MGIIFLATAEKRRKSCFVENVLEQEIAHDLVLDGIGDRVEQLLLFQEDGGPVVLPEVSEMTFDFILQLRAYVFAVTAQALIPDAFNQ